MTVYKFSNVSGFKNYQKYNDFLAGNPAVILDKGSMFPLGVFTLASSATNIEFTNIPQTYTHLQLRGITRSDNSAFWGGIQVQFNSDTTALYAQHNLVGNGSSASSGGSPNTTSFDIPFANVGASATSNIFGAFVLDILDYKNTNKFKTARSLNGRDLNGGGSEDRIGLISGLWRSTNAITSIKLTSQSSNFIANTSIALYGVLA